MDIHPTVDSSLHVHEWCALPHELREYLARVFDIQRTGSASVVDNVVESDGRTEEDLKAMTVAKLREYTHSMSIDIRQLILLCVAKYEKEKRDNIASTEVPATVSAGDEKGAGDTEVPASSEGEVIPTPVRTKRKYQRRKNDVPSSDNDAAPSTA